MAQRITDFRDGNLLLTYLAPGVRISAFAIISFLYIAAILTAFDLSVQLRDSLLFLMGGLVLAPVWVIIYYYFELSSSSREPLRRTENLTIWTVISFFILLATAHQTLWFAQDNEAAWIFRTKIILYLTLASHAVLTIVFVFPKKIYFTQLSTKIFSLPTSPQQIALFLVALSLAIALIFKIEPDTAQSESLGRILLGPQFEGTTITDWLFSVFVGLIVLLLVSVLTVTEPRVRGRYSKATKTVTNLILVVTIGMAIINYFDFSLTLEVLHYLTIVGPALHIKSGGTLLVDVFSQYGPGPVAMTYFSYMFAPNTLGTAQLTVQVFNLGFYAVWLVCLYRMTEYKLAALLLGFVAIGLQLASWGGGTSNINVAPSILGLRYLPTLLLVYSLSLLRAPRRHSILTFLSLIIASCWSFETFVGAFGIYGGFVALLALRDRKYLRGVLDVATISAVTGLAILMTAIATWLSSGELPQYDIYMSFFAVYNPVSSFWTFPASSTFFGWITPMLAVFLILADVWNRILAGAHPAKISIHITQAETNLLFYKFVPMALLVLPMAAYYAFRSIDYTLSIALLPTLALIIPGFLSLSIQLLRTAGPARLLAIIPTFCVVWLTAYTYIALTRADSPYKLISQECSGSTPCKLSKLVMHLNEKVLAKDILEPVGNYLSDRWIDLIKPKNLVRDVVEIIAKYSGKRNKVTVLLGQSIAGEMALLHSGKWQHWPISFAYTDSLVPSLVQRIVNAPVSLQPGDLVVITKGDNLSLVEQGIFLKIKSETVLCDLNYPSNSAIAYRVSKDLVCN